MPEEKIPARHFTRAEVSDYVTRVFTADDDNLVKVSGVCLLKGIACPIWVVDYRVIYSSGTTFESRFHSKAVVTEYRRNNPERTWELCLSPWFELPDGCASVQEENALLHKGDEDER